MKERSPSLFPDSGSSPKNNPNFYSLSPILQYLLFFSTSMSTTIKKSSKNQIHNGENTHHQDQSMKFVNFSTINIMVRIIAQSGPLIPLSIVMLGILVQNKFLWRNKCQWRIFHFLPFKHIQYVPVIKQEAILWFIWNLLQSNPVKLIP